MKNYSIYHEISINSIKPEGWLKNYLINQKHGLTGHLEVAGPPFDRDEDWTSQQSEGTNKKAWWQFGTAK